MPDTTQYFRHEILKLARVPLMPYIGLVDDTDTELTGGDYERVAVTWTDPDSDDIIYPTDSPIISVPGGNIVKGWRVYTEATGDHLCGGKDFTSPINFDVDGSLLLKSDETGLKAV